VSTHLSRVTTHVLDATRGRPAEGVGATLEHKVGDRSWSPVAQGTTDSDGRIAVFGPADLEPGVYRVWFDTGAYFARRAQQAFYPEVTLTFEIGDPSEHYHVPLLLSPYAFSTYRGS
jgi:5-hydroxyisourate hydrolase